MIRAKKPIHSEREVPLIDTNFRRFDLLSGKVGKAIGCDLIRPLQTYHFQRIAPAEFSSYSAMLSFASSWTQLCIFFSKTTKCF